MVREKQERGLKNCAFLSFSAKPPTPNPSTPKRQQHHQQQEQQQPTHQNMVATDITFQNALTFP